MRSFLGTQRQLLIRPPVKGRRGSLVSCVNEGEENLPVFISHSLSSAPAAVYKVSDKTGMSHSVTLPTSTLLTPKWAGRMFAGKTYRLSPLLRTVAQLLTSVLSLATPEYSVGSSRDRAGDRDIRAPLRIVCKRNLSWSLSPLMSATAPAPLSRTLLTLFFFFYWLFRRVLSQQVSCATSPEPDHQFVWAGALVPR